MKINIFKNILLGIYFLILTLLVYYTMPNLMLHYYPYGDATIFEYFGYAMTKGEKLYLDLFDHKGPIIFLINYAGYILNGAFGIKILYLICYFVFLIYAYKTAMLFTDKNIVSIITLLIITLIFLNIFESGLGLEGYMLPFITYSFYIYLDYFMNNRYNSLKIILVGFCFGIVFFTKYNMVGLWLILSVVVIILNIYKKEYKLLLKFILNFLVGFLILLIPLLIYFLINNSLLEMIYQSLIININYSGDAPIGLKDVISWIIGVANDYSLVLIILLSTFYYYKNSKNMVLIGIVLLTFCILLSIISKRTYLHYLIVLIPLFIPYISILLETLFDKINYRLSLVITCCFIVTSYFSSLVNIKAQIQERNVDNSRDIAELANYIKNNSNEDDRIYGHRMYGSIYLLSERLSSTRYFFIPGFYNENIFYEDYKKHFEKNYPKYIVIDMNKYSGFDLLTDDYIKDVIKNNYKLVKTVNNLSLYVEN